jgi:hypothetical protein
LEIVTTGQALGPVESSADPLIPGRSLALTAGLLRFDDELGIAGRRRRWNAGRHPRPTRTRGRATQEADRRDWAIDGAGAPDGPTSRRFDERITVRIGRLRSSGMATQISSTEAASLGQARPNRFV